MGPMAPTTAAPSTAAPTTMSPTEVKDACVNLKKRKCRNTCVFSKRQRQCLPKSTGIEHNTRGKLRVWKLKCANFHMGSVYTDVTEKMLADAENPSSAILTRL